MRYVLPFEAVALSATAGTYKTLAAIIVPDTPGVRVRVTALNIGPGNANPPDTDIEVKLNRIDDVSGGTAGTTTAVSAANMGKKDSGAPTCTVSGAVNYTAEPTVYNTTEPQYRLGMNARASAIKEWIDPDDMPKGGADQLIGLLAASRDTTQPKISGSIEFEVY
jgi:hypothetical protein